MLKRAAFLFFYPSKRRTRSEPNRFSFPISEHDLRLPILKSPELPHPDPLPRVFIASFSPHLITRAARTAEALVS